MDYVDLLDDSDDDIPLIPLKGVSYPSLKRSNEELSPLRVVSEDQTIDLVSSDDDIPILKRPKLSVPAADASKSQPSNPNYDSDCTVKYSCSSDENSLPDINIDGTTSKSNYCSAVSYPVVEVDSESSTENANYDKIVDQQDECSDESSLPDIGIDDGPPRTSALYDDKTLSFSSKFTNCAAAQLAKYGNSLPLKRLPITSCGRTDVTRSGAAVDKDQQLGKVSQIGQDEENENIDGTFTNIKAPLNSRAAKTREKALERETVRQQKLLVQAQKKEEKERKVLGKKRDIAMRKAEREARRVAQPGECHRHMLLETDKKLENTTLGVCIEASCVANCVPIKFVETPISNAVMFKRKLISHEMSSTSYVQDENMAVAIQMCDMVDMVFSTVSRTSTHLSLEGYIEKVTKTCKAKPTLVVIGCEKYFRTLKTQKNRVYRDNVLGTQANSKKNKDISVITRLQYEEAITALQMTFDTVVINHELEEEVAKTILRLNKSIAEAPVKRGRYEQQAMSVKTTGLKIGMDYQGCREVWQRTLQEFRNISVDVASAIISEWPSPYLLLKEYERLQKSGSSGAELLLQDIQIRRGGGVVQTRRRVGKETSRRVYELFTKQSDFVIK